ncbi:MAG TPA: hypothetical protein VNA89_07445 [Gemmatimonadaceae bacterium]|nr:hypothetical protein [Gemmatimonadaceae bacterium]
MTTPVTSPAYLPLAPGRIPRPGPAVLASLLGATLCAGVIVAAGDAWSPLSGSHQLLKLGWLVTLGGAMARTLDEVLRPVARPASRRPSFR